MKPQLIVEQKITAFANQYRIFSVDSNGEKGEMIAFAQQKRLAFKEKVTVYSDEKKTQEVFSFRAEKVMDIHGRFLVEDPGGNLLGAFRKDFKKSLLSSTWHILEDNKSKITITESSQVIALLRRFAGFIPIIGGVVELLTGFFKYHFSFIDSVSNKQVGKYQKITLFRDHYTLFMDEEAYKNNDWRVLAAMAVALDALQAR